MSKRTHHNTETAANTAATETAANTAATETAANTAATETAANTAATETAANTAATETAATETVATETAANTAATETAAERLAKARAELAAAAAAAEREAADKAAAARNTLAAAIDALPLAERLAAAAGIIAAAAADGAAVDACNALHAVSTNLEAAGIKGKLLVPKHGTQGGANQGRLSFQKKGKQLLACFAGKAATIQACGGLHPIHVSFDRSAMALTLRQGTGSWIVRYSDKDDCHGDLKPLEADGARGTSGDGARNPGANGTRSLWNAANNIGRPKVIGWKLRTWNAQHPEDKITIPAWIEKELDAAIAAAGGTSAESAE